MVSIAALYYLSHRLSGTEATYLVHVLTVGTIYAVLATSYNLVNGITGQFSLQPNAFAAIGAYTAAILTLSPEEKAMTFILEPILPPFDRIQLPFLPALLAGGGMAAAFAVLVGLPVFRVRGDYLAIVTLGFGEIVRIVATNAIGLTNGALGLKGLPPYTTLTGAFVWLVVTLVVITGLLRSPVGRAWRSIREDEQAARAAGINVFRYKLSAFVVSAFFQGVGGALLAHLLTTVDPKQFNFFFTFNLLIIIVVGGLGSMTGAVVGSFLFAGGSELLRVVEEPITIAGREFEGIPGLRMVIFSALLIVIMLFFRRGLFGRREFSWSIRGWRGAA
ncbi:MAG: branched-chain amino acid ABC transporter permease [Nitrospirae bacterium]|nr:branched-chain amino acid ABC transporter permease [Nitrospirota bacterium]